MEIIFENIKSNDWEFSTTLTGEDIIGVTGPEYEELLEVLRLEKIPEGKIIIDQTELIPENHL